MAFVLVLLCAFVSGALSLTDTERSAAKDAHNSYRSTLANGQAVNNDGTTLPQGANIFSLQYDASIESIAQNWANGCVFEHSPRQQRNGTGENLYMTSDEAVSAATVLRDAADLWWSELAEYGVNPNLNLTLNEFNRGIGHWSQMAWAKTVKLGCGVKSCPGLGTIVVCNYSPAGNYLNQLIYKAGNPCSDCSGFSVTACASPLCVAPSN
ncbi:venom allergen-like protein vap-2 [Aphelenchoides avenae]|nr:venom allergen-like protein vap-2 [Aphelenchus avenae]